MQASAPRPFPNVQLPPNGKLRRQTRVYLTREELDASPSPGAGDTGSWEGFIAQFLPSERLGAELSIREGIHVHIRVYALPMSPSELEAQWMAAVAAFAADPPVPNGHIETTRSERDGWQLWETWVEYGEGDYGNAFGGILAVRAFDQGTVVVSHPPDAFHYELTLDGNAIDDFEPLTRAQLPMLR